MKYKNTKTGAIIETSTRVSGENWKPEKKKTPSKNHVAGKDKSQEGTE